MKVMKKKDDAHWIIKREVGRWKVYDYTVLRHPELMRYVKNIDTLIPKTKHNNFLLDVESWYSITPVDLAKGISQSIKNKYQSAVSILDLFAGVGGNTVSFMEFSNVVDSVEFDYKKIKCLRNNVKVCTENREHRIFYFDVYNPQLLLHLKEEYDVIMASPPWGGLDYKQDTALELFMKCRVLELEAIYSTRAPLRLYMLPRQITDDIFLLLNDEFSVFNGFSKSPNRVVAKILAVGDVEGFKLKKCF
ncbi:hypothetical protein NEMIN01_1066 [Nematocida minor]|uniref:uncharacterized protein n=1 Tax=Nematocida minor TaxID=1912983 RepID=UPI00221F659C|nr:uncharacterized protein NEMIN01_1066 [Nematocida minor]KAI5190528.1 hypothetical protein NEMIN01_1066 [Nematocida minor]